MHRTAGPGAAHCGYYTYLQGTSMASPHASGVAALIVSRFGKTDGTAVEGMAPAKVEQQLYRTAARTPARSRG